MKYEDAARLAGSITHPLRIEMLETLRGNSPISPVEFSRLLDAPLGNCAYHLGALRRLGVIKVAETHQRRGAVEHRYAPVNGRRWRVVRELLDVLEDG